MILRSVMTALLLTTCLSVCNAQTQTLTVREFLQQKENWAKWSRDRTRLTITGRYAGRAGRQFQLEQFPAPVLPGRTAVLPLDLSRSDRLAVTGILVVNGSRMIFEATGITRGRSDMQALEARIAALKPDDAEGLVAVASEFNELGVFYNDRDLLARVRQLRRQAWGILRRRSRADVDRLLQLADQAAEYGVDDRTAQATRFEALLQREDADAQALDQLLKSIQKLLPGWNKPTDLPEALLNQFEQDKRGTYESADDSVRRKLERVFYRRLRLRQILAALKPDHSNARDIARLVETELPEEQQQIAELNEMYIAYRTKQVPQLSRSQLQDLDQLLRDNGRAEEFGKYLDQWLKAQDQLLNNGRPDGLLLTAEQYQYAYERWKNPKHRDAEAELLKQAWNQVVKTSPADAEPIAERLRSLGWQRLRDRWMTEEQVRRLPRDDVELALQQKRAVSGMKRDQIVQVMGEPNRIVRVISANAIQEIWIFGDRGSTQITVHLERGRLEKPSDAAAVLVSRIAR